jgi:hypothetical protein
MRFGCPFSAGYGSIDYPVTGILISRIGNTSIKISFSVHASYINSYYGIYINSALVTIVYATNPEVNSAIVARPYETTRIFVAVIRIGHLAAWNMQRAVRILDAQDSKRVTLQWTWPNRFIGVSGDSGKTSNWSLDGITWEKTQSVIDHPNTWRRLQFDIKNLSGLAQVTLYDESTILAQGTGEFETTITLSELNGSGISGKVDVSEPEADIISAYVYFEWPIACKIIRDWDIIATVSFLGITTQRWTEPADLEPGTYCYLLQPISENGDLGTVSAGNNITILKIPAPPRLIEYFSGDAVSGFTLHACVSTDPGCSYKLYSPLVIGEPPNMLSPEEIEAVGLWTPETSFLKDTIIEPTVVHGGTGYRYKAVNDLVSGVSEPEWPTTPGETIEDGTGHWECIYMDVLTPAISGYPGKFSTILRAELAAVEEKNLNEFEIEVDSEGERVPGRPNAPSISVTDIVISLGLQMSLRVAYSIAGEKASPKKAQLFVRSLNGEYTFDSPVATADFLEAGNFATRYATILYNFPANAPVYICCKAATLDGVQSAEASDEIILNPSNQDFYPLGYIELFHSRG